MTKKCLCSTIFFPPVPLVRNLHYPVAALLQLLSSRQSSQSHPRTTHLTLSASAAHHQLHAHFLILFISHCYFSRSPPHLLLRENPQLEREHVALREPHDVRHLGCNEVELSVHQPLHELLAADEANQWRGD